MGRCREQARHGVLALLCYNSTMPMPKPTNIKLDKIQMRELSHYLGFNLQSADQLIARVKEMSTLSVEGVEITLEPALLQRLKSRCFKQELGDLLRFEIRRQLRAFVGM